MMPGYTQFAFGSDGPEDLRVLISRRCNKKEGLYGVGRKKKGDVQTEVKRKNKNLSLPSKLDLKASSRRRGKERNKNKKI